MFGDGGAAAALSMTWEVVGESRQAREPAGSALRARFTSVEKSQGGGPSGRRDRAAHAHDCGRVSDKVFEGQV